jgi:hypothetical protein
MDKKAGMLVVDRFLYTAMRYPENYGFIRVPSRKMAIPACETDGRKLLELSCPSKTPLMWQGITAVLNNHVGNIYSRSRHVRAYPVSLLGPQCGRTSKDPTFRQLNRNIPWRAKINIERARKFKPKEILPVQVLRAVPHGADLTTVFDRIVQRCCHAWIDLRVQN